MEGRHKGKNSDYFAKKPTRELVIKRKTLGHSLRSTSEKVRDIPPLTPLHRLQRFKAIRDRNLKKKLRQGISQNNMDKKMDEVKNEDICLLKKPIPENEAHESNGVSEDISNLQNGHGTNGFSNGHRSSFDADKEEDIQSSTKDIDTQEENVRYEEAEFLLQEDKNEEKNEKEPDSSFEENYEDAYHNEEQVDQGKSESVDGEDGSSSSSTFPSVKGFMRFSNDNDSETKNGSSDDENDQPEKASCVRSLLQEEVEEKKTPSLTESSERPHLRKVYPPSKIPRSTSSASSYKSAYNGSAGRISGRRPVERLERKRKAEEDLDCSQASPNWRYFPSSISSIWSPKKTPGYPTPARGAINDSMAVNINEDSFLAYPEDTESNFNTKDQAPPPKRFRFGCSIM